MLSLNPEEILLGELWTRLTRIIGRIGALADQTPHGTDDGLEHHDPTDWYGEEADEYLALLDTEYREGLYIPASHERPLEDALEQKQANPFIYEYIDRGRRRRIGDTFEHDSEDDLGGDGVENQDVIESAARKDILRRTIAAIRDAIVLRNSANLRALLDELVAACDIVGFEFDELLAQAERVVMLLDVKSPTLIYLPPRPKLYIPQLLIESNEMLIRKLARYPKGLFSISPRKFEEIIAELFWRAGYEVELTAQTRDGGRDIIAISRSMDIPLRLIIECKRHALTNKVGLALVQRLFGVKIAEFANKAILATTSTFTRDARMFASSHLWDLDLKDHDDVVAWLGKYPNITTG